MELSIKHKVRIAQIVQDQLQKSKRHRWQKLSDSLESAVRRLDRLNAIKHKLELCGERGWTRASQRLTSEAEATFADIAFTAQDLQRHARRRPPLPSMRDLVADLSQLEDEFGELKYDRPEQALSVVTEPIELEDIYLGDFEIRLQLDLLDRIGRGPVYRVVALDPHPAGGNDSVTHPHVQDETLCAGDAGAAIDTALSSGRLCDFFMLVRSVLQHYNPDSPYVSLDRWEGITCADCGYTVNEEDVYYCHLCDAPLCEDCAGSCFVCEETTCGSCMDTCPVCEEPVCRACMTTCPECGEVLCRACFEDHSCACGNEEDDDEQEKRQETEAAQREASRVSEETR